MKSKDCDTIGDKAQVIQVWDEGPRCWEHLSPTKSKGHEGKAKNIEYLMASES